MLRLVAASAFEGKRSRVEQVSLAVHAGELVVVAGGRGAGASLLLTVAAGRRPLAAGEVWLGQDELSRLRSRARAQVVRHIGYGGPETPLLGGTTLLENVMLPEIARGKHRVAASAQAFHALGALELASVANDDVASLDAAERRLGLVARACVGHPRLCVLDGPDEELQEEDAHRVLLLLRARAGTGSAILLASTNPSFLGRAQRLGARIVRMQEGRLLPVAGPGGLVVTSSSEAPPSEPPVRVEIIA